MMKRNLVPIIVVATSLFAGIGLTAFAFDSPQGSTPTTDSLDVTLNERIETLLLTDTALAGGQFRTQTRAGVVTLGGTVPDEQSLRRALDLVSSVKGVRKSATAWWSKPQSSGRGRAGPLAGSGQVDSRVTRSAPSSTVSPSVTCISTTRPA